VNAMVKIFTSFRNIFALFLRMTIDFGVYIALFWALAYNGIFCGEVNFTWWAGRKNLVAVNPPSQKWLYDSSSTPGTRFHAAIFMDDLKNTFYLIGGDALYGNDFNVANDVWICDLSLPYNNQWVTPCFNSQ
jgi:hypothetical protein